MNLCNASKKNPNTFVISLDAIDLNYFPTTLNRSCHNGVTPIWTKGNLDLRNDEYFEFEIKNKDDSISDSEEEVTDDIIDYTICHICDISVPKPYINEHNMSVKHKTHKKVIEIALDRTKRNINHADVIQNIKQNQQAYFCTSCVAVIKLKDKKEHENSIIHKNSVIVDKILQDFLILYTNNDGCDLDINVNCDDSTVQFENNNVAKNSVQKPYLDTVYTVENNNNSEKFVQKHKTDNSSTKEKKIDVDDFVDKLINDNNLSKTLKAMSDDDLLQTLININEKFKKSDANHATDSALGNGKVKTNTLNNPNNSSVEDMKRYIEVMNKIYCIKFDITVMDNMNLEISTLEGSSVNVPTNNFLGLKYMDKNYLQCLLCQEVIKLNSKEQHIYGNIHMKKVSTLFKDKHCVRIIDLSWNHCVICNLIIENSDLHVLCNDEHSRQLKRALVSDVEEIHTPSPNNSKVDSSANHKSITASGENGNILCADKVKCNVDIGFDKNSQIKVKNDDLKQNEQEEAISNNPIKYCVICEIDVLLENLKVHLTSTRHKINTEIKSLEVHYLMEIVSQEELKCLICLCPVKRNSAAVQRHLLSKNHVKLYNKLLTGNNMKDLKNCRFYCLVCKIQVFKMNELSHVNDEAHKKAMEEIVLTNIAETNVVIPNKEPLDTDNQYLCVLCNVHVPNTETCIYIHNSGGRHLKNLSQATIDSTVKNNTSTSSTETLQSNNIFELHYHMTLTKESDNLYCIVCDVNVTLHEKNMHEHIKGNNHRTNYRKILESNHLILDDNKLSCQLCLVSIDDKQELIHCKSKKHHKSLELHEKSLDKMALLNPMDNVSPKPLATVGINQPSTSANMNTNKPLRRYLLQPTENPNTLMCMVCNVSVPNNEGNITTYLRGRGHCQNYEAVIKQNNLIESETYFKCNLCDVTFPKGTELNHINDAQHNLHIGIKDESKDDMVENVKIENIYKCSICNMKLTNSEANITEHNTGSHHVQKVKLFTENKLTFKEGAVYCEMCELGFPQTEIWEHLETVKHVIAKHFHSS